MKNILIILLSSLALTANAQTVGVLSSTDDVSEGLTFFSPFSSTKAYLVDNCGNLVNEWDRGTRPGLSAYLLDSGLMLRTYKVDPVGPYTSASNAGGIELVDWDNNLVWKYEINTEEQLSHHDAIMIPNGNVLVLTWQLTFRDEIIQLGRNPSQIAPQNFMWSEKIIELEPVGIDSARIVWEWHINDHLIQDFDDTKDGFGVVSEHPELFDINQPDLSSGNSNASRDWFHFNAIDYNEDLDQILISIRNSDEIWILDHSTTTEEAAGHTGGRYGQGGDILYRWGNPFAYKVGTADNQMLWGQHGVNWIDEGLEDEGAIMIFNNGNARPGADYSEIQLLYPPQSSPGFYIKEDSIAFGPATAINIYGNQTDERFYSPFLSNALRLDNGNTIVNSGTPGRIFEITADREIAWEYEIPLFGDFPATQGQNVNNNSNFRAYKYPLNYSGFDNVDITPGPPIELNPNDCDLVISSTENLSVDYIIYSSDRLTINFEGFNDDIDYIEVRDVYGRLMDHQPYSDNKIQLRNVYATGIYLITVKLKTGLHYSQKIFLK
jgi:hypothetical protein